MLIGSFDLLSPDEVVRAIEQAYGCVLDGTLDSYPSYVNRVYSVRREDGERLVAKFYRPGRWSREAILDEHRFLLDCSGEEIPVIAPLSCSGGLTLHETAVSSEGRGARFLFALFPRTGGRAFEPETNDDMLRLGALLGRVHAAGARGKAPNRAACDPQKLTSSYVEEVLAEGVVHPKCREDFESVCTRTLREIFPLFEGVPSQRIHGDCHRGNIIDRPGQGLALIDFDDMMTGSPVQDLWLLLPGYAADCLRELDLMLEGYEPFTPFDRRTLTLIEPLRFMRMIYFLAWRARQRGDFWFRSSFPDWGNEAFWIKETEDLRVQAEVIHESLDE